MNRRLRKSLVFFTLLTVIVLSTIFILPSMLFAQPSAWMDLDLGANEMDPTFTLHALDCSGYLAQFELFYEGKGIIGQLADVRNVPIDSNNWQFVIDKSYWPGYQMSEWPGLYTANYWITDKSINFVTSGGSVEFRIKGNGHQESEEPQPWVRNHEMQCWQVWINQDNAFEFVFVWEYANNNHVQIFDMAGNLVFATDMQKGNAHFVAALPDGMYTVKTFHEAGYILQEFVIGKP